MKTRCTAALLALFLCFGWVQPALFSSCLAADSLSMSADDCAPMAVAHEEHGRHDHAGMPDSDSIGDDAASAAGACCCSPQAIINTQNSDVFFVGLQIELVTNYTNTLISSLHVNDLLRPPASLAV